MSRRGDVVIRQLTGWHLPPIAWHRLQGRRVGLMDQSLASQRIRRIARAWGATRVDLGEVVGPERMSSPWTELDSLLPNVLRSVPGLAREFPGGHAEEDLWKMSLRRDVAKHGLDQLIAVRWAEGHRIVYYGTSVLDPRIGRALGGRIASVRIWPNLISSTISRITHRAESRHLRAPVSADKVEVGLPPLRARPGPSSCAKARVLFIVNRGLEYGGLYRYDQFFSDDVSSAFHEANMAYVASETRTLENGYQALALPRLLTKRPSVRLLLLELQTLLGIRGDFDLEAHRESFLFRTDSYTHGIACEFPRVKVAIFAFDIQVPIEFSAALRRRGIRSIASHERPQGGLVPYLTLVADRLLTASAEFSRLLDFSPHAWVRECLPCGFWRTDRLVEALSARGGEAPQRPMVLVLLYELPDEDAVSRMPSELTVAGFTHFLEDMSAVAEQFPQADFIVRAKTDAWSRDSRVAATVGRLALLPNVSVSHEYTTALESYRLAAMSTLVIGKYTSLIEEALACDIPALIHDFTHNAHEGMCEMSSYLPGDVFVHSRAELLERTRDVLADDGREFRKSWRPNRVRLYGSLSDGHSRERSLAAAQALLGEADPVAGQ